MVLLRSEPGYFKMPGLLLLILILAMVYAGCSRGDAVLPGTVPDNGITAATGDTGSNRQLWGFYFMELSDDHTQLDVIPARNALMHLNVLEIMQKNPNFPPTVKNISIDPIDGTIYATLVITHPFPQFTRFTAFDVRGIIMLPGGFNFPELGVKAASPFLGHPAMLNPDGYTRRWNPSEYLGEDMPFGYIDGNLVKPGAASLVKTQVNPYRAYWTEGESRRLLKAGTSVEQIFHMSFPPGGILFAMAIDASWKAPFQTNDDGSPVHVPNSFDMDANSLEPYNVQVTNETGQLECSISEWAGGTVMLSILVQDWQGGSWVGHENAAIEAPELFNGVVHSWAGVPSGNDFIYEFVVPNNLKMTPGVVPALISFTTIDEDLHLVNIEHPIAYQMYTLEVVEVNPPFCSGVTGIQSAYGGSFPITGTPGQLHLDTTFLPVITGGAGGLLFDGGLIGGNEHIQLASIPPAGAPVNAITLFQRMAPMAGNALLLQGNDFNGHLFAVTTFDRDNVLVYNTTGSFLAEYDLGDGDNGINEPVAFTADTSNGDFWLIGDKGSGGIHLERWGYVSGGSTFAYFKDPASQLDLQTFLAGNSKVLGLAINGHYRQLYIFHTANNGTVDTFDLSQTPPAHLPVFSATNVFGEALAPISVPGIRKYIGGDLVIDHTDGDLAGQCRILAFANTASGSSKLVRLDSWGRVLNFAPLGSPFSCMAINNLPDPASRSLVFFPTIGSVAYNLFLPPIGVW